jgi:hypothetical protein
MKNSTPGSLGPTVGEKVALENWPISVLDLLDGWSQEEKERGDSESLSISSASSSEPCPGTGIRDSLRPLAIFAKIFGLFPTFDLGFGEGDKKGRDRGLDIPRILDYAYSAAIFGFLTTGSVYVTLNRPATLRKQAAQWHYEDTDYLVVMVSFFMTMVMGLVSLFIFSRRHALLLKYARHFAEIDR